MPPLEPSPELRERYLRAGAWHDQTVFERVAVLAAEDPEREAVCDQTRRLSYADLLSASERLAAFLIDAGVLPQEVVAFQSGNSVELAVVHLACSRAGATFVPLSDAWRQSEVRHILEVAGAAVAIVPATGWAEYDFLGAVSEIRSDLPALRLLAASDGGGDFSLPAVISAEPAGQPGFPAGDPDLPRYVMVSSGTTSAPKLSLWSDNNLWCFRAAWSQAVALSYKDRVVGLAPAGTGAIGYVFGVLFPLLTGATSILLERWEPAAALGLMADERASLVAAVPTQLVKLLQEAGSRRLSFPDLRVVTNAGAPLSPDVAAAVEQRWRCRVQTVYGATDGGVPLMTRIDDRSEIRHSTAGRPVPLTDVRLVDARSRPVDPGKAGEIQWRGPTKSYGYLNDPARTAEMFTEDGFYRSGDLAQAASDGSYRIVGRSKDMIIRGGQNIAPAEIEEVLALHPAVSEVAAVGIPDDVYGERVCVAIVPRAGGELDLSAVVEFMAARPIAKFKLPERLELFDELPKTATGKLSKDEIRDRVLARSARKHSAVA
jgi:non-ribosomal peptide synthetase component E (peptide arylation enzyme)